MSSMLTQFIMILMISKYGGLEAIGVYGLISSIVMPITTFFLFDIFSSVIAEKNLEENISKYFGNYFLNTMISITPVIATSMLFNVSIKQALGFFLFRVSINLKEIIYSYYQRKNRFQLISYNQIGIMIVSSIVFSLIYITSISNDTAFYLCAFVVFLSTILDYNRIGIKKIIIIEFSFFKDRFKSSFVLGLNAIISSIKINAPKYFIQFSTQNLELLGIITVYQQLNTGLSVLNLIYCRLNLGKVGNLINDEPKHWRKKIYQIIIGNYALIIFFGAILLLVDKFVINLIFGNDYINNLNLFKILVLITAVTFPLFILKIISINKNIESKLTQATILSTAVLLILIFFTDIDLYLFLKVYLFIDVIMIVYVFLKIKNVLNRKKLSNKN